MRRFLFFLYISLFLLKFTNCQVNESNGDTTQRVLSIYIMPFTVFDPYYSHLRLGADYLINQNFKLDIDVDFTSGTNMNNQFQVDEFYGVRVLGKYAVYKKSKVDYEFRENLGLEVFYNTSDIICDNHYYHEANNFNKIIYYESAMYNRIKYGLNLIYSLNIISRSFYFEPYVGTGICYVNYSYYNVKNPVSGTYSFDEKKPILGDNNFKEPGKTFKKINFIMGIKIGMNIIKK